MNAYPVSTDIKNPKAEGRQLIEPVGQRIEPEYDATLRLEFTRACRGTVWATVASALVQGVLFGAGFFVINLLAGLQAGSWVLLLSLLTIVCGTVPFWVPSPSGRPRQQAGRAQRRG